MKRGFMLGKTETGVLRLVAKGSSEEDVIRCMLGEGLASSRHIVKEAINRLIEKKFIKRIDDELELTEVGEKTVDVLKG
ncbi:MAG: hypothetical protein KKI07_01825 [Euryarchaeota archaeon]|nr:hypothetical protein [Euryarchaeota archaeon]MDI6639506.1 hypothetical protein [Methanocellales archaeon]MDI6859547.1 hypothetical protein [Methanocellales archaeon]MDI6903364.1 hypothetical protein [Methanocellales archaeon]